MAKTERPGAGVAETVRAWFAPGALDELMGPAETETQRIGIGFLAAGGKRWRPTLTAAVFQMLGGEVGKMRPVAVGIECFHKASLIHDDIEDDDDERYHSPTIHKRFGIPAAINAGDWLIGEGYRQIATSSFAPEIRDALVRVAAAGHCALSLGQGEDIVRARDALALSEKNVLYIYERKTAAAFEVALLSGARAAAAGEDLCARLSAFSRAIGTAYQIQDDIDDFRSGANAADMLAFRPTLYLAEACASRDPAIRAALSAARYGGAAERRELIRRIEAAGLDARVAALYAGYRREAADVLEAFPASPLREFLHATLEKMLRAAGSPR